MADNLPAPLLEPITELLLGRNFRRGRNGLWTRESGEGISAIQFSRDPRSWEGVTVFTAHLGYLSYRLAGILGPEGFRFVGPESIHWYRWIGYLGEDDHEAASSSWSIRTADVAEVRSVVELIEVRGLATLEHVGSDVGIRDSWLLSPDPWLHKSVQAAYLGILVHALGPSEKLPGIRAQLAEYARNGGRDAAAALASIGTGTAPAEARSDRSD